jgi:hypothetical protein
MIVAIIVCIAVFLLYLHWIEQYKTGEDLEIYEIDYTTREHLQDVCKSKQPVLFEFASVLSQFHFLNTLTLDDLAGKYGKIDVYVKDTDDYVNNEKREGVDSIPLTLESSLTLMKTDTRSHYISEGNEDLVKDTVLEARFDSFHEHFQPSFLMHKQMDIWYGSTGASTPLRYNTEYNHFLYVPTGKIRVKMTPRKSTKYLHTIKDYVNYEFYSPVNVWQPQPQYANEIEKIQFLDFDVYGGNVLFVPPYWWYSIQYENEGTFMYSVKYNTIMNLVANAHNIGQHLYKKNTVTQKPAKVLVIEPRQAETEEITVPIL